MDHGHRLTALARMVHGAWCIVHGHIGSMALGSILHYGYIGSVSGHIGSMVHDGDIGSVVSMITG